MTRALYQECLRRGLVAMSYAPSIRINPPLVITEEQALDRAGHPGRGAGRGDARTRARSRMLRGAIIGLGNVALDGHLPGWSAARRRRDRRRHRRAAPTGGPRRRRACRGRAGSTRPRRCWSIAGLDFVDICTPPSSHAPLIERALTRGLHVLCEKPLVRSPAELDARRPAGRRARPGPAHRPQLAPRADRAAGGRAHPGTARSARVRRVAWQTLRVRPAAAARSGRRQLAPRSGRRRRRHPDRPRLARLLHRPALDRRAPHWRVSARLETRRHAHARRSRTPRRVRLTFPDATAEILLTWAADERRNWARLDGADGTPRARATTRSCSRAARDERAVAVPARAVQRLRAPGLVRPVAGRVRGGGDRRPADTAPTSPRPRSASCSRASPASRAAVTARRCPCRRRRARPGGARLSAVTTPAAPPRAAGVLVVLPPRAGDARLGSLRILRAAAGPAHRAGRDVGRLRVRPCRRGRRRRGGARGHRGARVARRRSRRDPVPSVSCCCPPTSSSQRALAARRARDAARARDALRRWLAGRGRRDQAGRGRPDGRPRRSARAETDRPAARDVHDGGAAGRSGGPPVR